MPTDMCKLICTYVGVHDCEQVAPSFFDAPGSQDTASSGDGSAAVAGAAAPSMGMVASVQRLQDELPNITFAFASQVGFKVGLCCCCFDWNCSSSQPSPSYTFW